MPGIPISHGAARAATLDRDATMMQSRTISQDQERHMDCLCRPLSRKKSRIPFIVYARSHMATPLRSSPHPRYSLVIFCSFFLLFFGILWILEIELERAHEREWTEKSKQVQPYYWWQFLTHDGRDIGYEHKGPLKLALHPYAVYSNLPNQLSDHFSIDERGFRANGLGRRHDGKKRVVLVGGSTAFGTGLESDTETVATQLAQLLDAEVINAAVIGHGSGQELTYLLTELVDLHPDVVVALDGWNDYYKRLELSDPRLLGMNGFDEIEAQLVASAGLEDPSLVKRLSNVPRLLFPRISYRVKYSRIGLWAGWLDRGEAPSPSIELAATHYVENLTKMQRIGTAFHYRFLVAMQPDVDHATDYRTFREKAGSALRRGGIRVLDLGAHKEFVPRMFTDQMHLNAEGHRVMAEIIAGVIRDEHLLAEWQ